MYWYEYCPKMLKVSIGLETASNLALYIEEDAFLIKEMRPIVENL
ncbi:hypothetical protein ACIQ1H_13995 [Lysinibacillus sp. NPDC097279]